MAMAIRIGIGALAVVLATVAVAIIRTLSYGSLPDAAEGMPPLPDPVVFDEEAAVRHLSRAIAFETVSVDRGVVPVSAADAFSAMHGWLETTYPRAHAIMTRDVFLGHTLLFRWEGSETGRAPIVLMAHQDVVPADTEASGWSAPPFSGAVVNGQIIGRGTLDDKGSVIALLEAAEALLAQGFTPKRTVYFLFGHDEEVGGAGAEAAFTALADRGVEAAFVLDEGMITVDPNPMTGKPISIIGVGEKGYLTLRIVAEDEGGHSSTPPADPAVFRLARALSAIEAAPLPTHFNADPAARFLEAMGPDLPFPTRLALANRWLLGPVVEGAFAAIPAANAMIRTTTAPTVLTASSKDNILPTEAAALVNFRIHPADTPDGVVAHVERVVAGLDRVRVEIVESSAAQAVSPMEGDAYDAIAAIAKGIAPNAPVAPGLVLGATDSRHASAVSDRIYRYMPIAASAEEMAGVHGVDEKIAVEDYLGMIRAYQQLILLTDGVGD